MADSQYVTAAGFVQYDPAVREANGKEVTDLTIKLPGGEGTQIRVTVWPELEYEGTIEKGDWVAVDGKFSVNSYEAKDGTKRSSNQISANYLALVKGAKRSEREVVSGPKGDTKIPF